MTSPIRTGIFFCLIFLLPHCLLCFFFHFHCSIHSILFYLPQLSLLVIVSLSITLSASTSIRATSTFSSGKNTYLLHLPHLLFRHSVCVFSLFRPISIQGEATRNIHRSRDVFLFTTWTAGDLSNAEWITNLDCQLSWTEWQQLRPSGQWSSAQASTKESVRVRPLGLHCCQLVHGMVSRLFYFFIFICFIFKLL